MSCNSKFMAKRFVSLASSKKLFHINERTKRKREIGVEHGSNLLFWVFCKLMAHLNVTERHSVYTIINFLSLTEQCFANLIFDYLFSMQFSTPLLGPRSVVISILKDHYHETKQKFGDEILIIVLQKRC